MERTEGRGGGWEVGGGGFALHGLRKTKKINQKKEEN